MSELLEGAVCVSPDSKFEETWQYSLDHRTETTRGNGGHHGALKTSVKLQIQTPERNNCGQKNTIENLRPQNKAGKGLWEIKTLKAPGENQKKRTIHMPTQTGCAPTKGLRRT